MSSGSSNSGECVINRRTALLIIGAFVCFNLAYYHFPLQLLQQIQGTHIGYTVHSLPKSLRSQPAAVDSWLVGEIASALLTTPPHPAPYKVGVCAAVEKDDGQYLLEWAMYHYFIGVEHIYLYDRGGVSEDGVDLESSLRPLIDRGLLTHIKWGRDEGPYVVHCYNDPSYQGAVEWMAALDIDDFLVVGGGGAVYPTIQGMGGGGGGDNGWRRGQ